MPSLRKRCKNGTRKNKTKQCVPTVRLTEEEIQSLLQKYSLRPDAANQLKKLRLTKRSAYDYKYNKLFDDKTNLMRQADSFISNVLATTMFKTPKKSLKIKAPIKGTRF